MWHRLRYPLYLFGLAILGFSFLEIYVRQVKPKVDLLVLNGQRLGASPLATWAQRDAFSAFKPKPGKYRLSLGDDPIHKTVNQHYFISTPELDVAKPANTIRIVF